jgi:hypothetical protein
MDVWTANHGAAKENYGNVSHQQEGRSNRDDRDSVAPFCARAGREALAGDFCRRPKGATLAEIVDAAGWQKHTVRGFVSILGSKGGEKIESSNDAGGERTYHIAE